MKRLWLIPVYIAVLIGAPVALSCYNRVQRGYGARDAAIAALKAKSDSLENDADSLKTALQARITVLTVYRTKWDTLPPLIPTLSLPEAPPVPAAQLAQVIFLGNETIKRCSEALNTCQSLQAKKDTLIALLTVEKEQYKRQIPTAWDRWLEWGIRVGAFYLGTQVRVR